MHVSFQQVSLLRNSTVFTHVKELNIFTRQEAVQVLLEPDRWLEEIESFICSGSWSGRHVDVLLTPTASTKVLELLLVLSVKLTMHLRWRALTSDMAKA